MKETIFQDLEEEDVSDFFYYNNIYDPLTKV